MYLFQHWDGMRWLHEQIVQLYAATSGWGSSYQHQCPAKSTWTPRKQRWAKAQKWGLGTVVRCPWLLRSGWWSNSDRRRHHGVPGTVRWMDAGIAGNVNIELHKRTYVGTNHVLTVLGSFNVRPVRQNVNVLYFTTEPTTSVSLTPKPRIN